MDLPALYGSVGLESDPDSRDKGYRSCNIAIPGSSFPSRYSSDAPPPVEMWVIRSATPAFSTADALSPPPMMVTALEEASARAISFVPRANASISKTPTGPFQMIVPADRIASLNSATVSGPISTPIMSAGI